MEHARYDLPLPPAFRHPSSDASEALILASMRLARKWNLERRVAFASGGKGIIAHQELGPGRLARTTQPELLVCLLAPFTLYNPAGLG